MIKSQLNFPYENMRTIGHKFTKISVVHEKYISLYYSKSKPIRTLEN